MNRINLLSDDLLIKVLSFLPTKVAVSTSILSKRWEKLWMWLPKFEYSGHIDLINRSLSSRLRYQDFITKSLSLHIALVIESLCLRFTDSMFRPVDIKPWVEMAISRCVRELSISYFCFIDKPQLVLPTSLYTCKSLVTLELVGEILVDVPQKACLPSLKTLKLGCVTYLNEDCLGLLLSYCPVLEHLYINRHGNDNLNALVVNVPSLQSLSLRMNCRCFSGGYVIDTPSLKYFQVKDYRDNLSYVIEPMPKLEEACIAVYKIFDNFLKSITSVKRLSLQVSRNDEVESMYPAGIVFNQLEHLKLSIRNNFWSKLLVRLLKDSPKLRVLNLNVNGYFIAKYEGISWSNESVPKCLSQSLETFEFRGYKGRREERDFLLFILENERRLKSTSILRVSSDE